jgi:hypothetical protein
MCLRSRAGTVPALLFFFYEEKRVIRHQNSALFGWIQLGKLEKYGPEPSESLINQKYKPLVEKSLSKIISRRDSPFTVISREKAFSTVIPA